MELAAAILQALTAVIGKKYTLDQFQEGAGDDKKPLSKDVIVKTITDDYKAKHSDLITVSEEKVKKIEQAERKKVYEEVETLAKSKFGVDIKWTEDKFGPLEEHFNDKIKNTKITPEDATKSEAYIALKGDLKLSKAENAKLKADHQQERIFDKVEAGIPNVLGNEQYKFVIPKSEAVQKTALRTAKQALRNAEYNGVKVKWELVDGELKAKDLDGHPIHDENGNEVTPSMVKVAALRSVYDVNEANPRGSAGAGDKGRQGVPPASAAASVITYSKGDEQKTFTMPQFKNRAEGKKYLVDNALSLDKGARDAVRQHVNELQDSTE